ncbi:putative BEL1-like homeodomain protein 8 [Diplocarpon rosae]|nr:putative BEL1-like homeodomain protein 8 [Diplocarpon rosae]
MPPKDLELDRFGLVSRKENLQIDVAAVASFQVPDQLSNMNQDMYLQALASRNIWVSRGRGCRIDMEITVDGVLLQQDRCYTILQSLGVRIRDLKLWQQLFLSTSLDLFPEALNTRQSQLSILLKDTVQSQGDREEQAAWLGGNIDLKPPDSVVCWEFERLHVRLDFMRIQRVPPKIKDLASANEESFAEMLSDVPVESIAFPTNHLELLESAANDLKVLPEKMANYFGIINAAESESRPWTLGKNVEGIEEGSIASIISSGKIFVAENPKDRNGKFSVKVVETIRTWLVSHYSSQLNKLLVSHRRKLSKDMSRDKAQKYEMLSDLEVQPGKAGEIHAIEDIEMLLDVDDRNTKTVELSEKAEEAEDDEIIFSQSFNSTPTSPFVWASTNSSMSPASSLPRQQTNTSESASLLPNLASSNLVETSMYTLFGGYIGPRVLGMRDIELRKIPPSLSLCVLIPTLFCPRFKETMAYNNRFLSSVSHAVSVSWPAHVQTPSLRRKLLRLSDLNPSPYPAYPTKSGEPGTRDRLLAVVQSRLWAMMQKKVYDKSGGRKLWRHTIERETGGSDAEEEDNLEEKFSSLEEFDRKMDIIDSDAMLFNDYDEDDDLLMGNIDEDDSERHAIESETYEMLFGSEEADDEDVLLMRSPEILAGEQTDDDRDMLLLSDEGEGDSMLL